MRFALDVVEETGKALLKREVEPLIRGVEESLRKPRLAGSEQPPPNRSYARGTQGRAGPEPSGKPSPAASVYMVAENCSAPIFVAAEVGSSEVGADTSAKAFDPAPKLMEAEACAGETAQGGS